MITNDDVIQTMKTAELAAPIGHLEADVPLNSQGLDSLDIATALLALEAKYDKSIPPEKAARLRTISDITAYLNS